MLEYRNGRAKQVGRPHPRGVKRRQQHAMFSLADP
jgi:hypothetical protein